jgi:hypothetical protein
MFGRITKWLLFFEYEFVIIYKPGRTHVVVDALFKLLYSLKPLGVPYCGCIIIFCGTYMDAKSKKLFRDRSNVRNFELDLKTNVGQKGITFLLSKRE